MQILSQMYPWMRRALLNFLIWIRTLEWIRNGFTSAEVCFLRVLVLLLLMNRSLVGPAATELGRIDR